MAINRQTCLKGWNLPGEHHTGQKRGNIMMRHPPTFDPGRVEEEHRKKLKWCKPTMVNKIIINIKL